MVKTIQCYLDGAGNMHRSALDAHRSDVQHWLQSTGAVNEASAASLAAHIVDDLDNLKELIAMLEPIVEHAPFVAKDLAA